MRHESLWAGPIVLGLALSALTAAPAVAQRATPSAAIEREANGPLIAVVSIADQRMHVYDKDGTVARSPISSGQPGYRTPMGVFSIIQKKVDPTSNIYFAPMPYMQRITWSGIALHAGALPGYPASHGCIRLPHSFARDFYRMTDLGMRVIVSPDDAAPQAFAHKTLFSPRPLDLAPLMARLGPRDGHLLTIAATDRAPARTEDAERVARATIPGAMRLGVATTAEAETRRAAPSMTTTTVALAPLGPDATVPVVRQHARAALVSATRDAQAERQATESVRARLGRMISVVNALERTADKAADRVAGAQQAFRRARTVRAVEEAIVAERRAAEQLADAARALDALGPDGRAARAEMTGAAEKLTAAETRRAEAQALVGELDRMGKPVHVLISRKTGKIYMRQGYEPVLEAPVTIADAGRPLGTHVFTAMSVSAKEATWTVVTVEQKDVVREARKGHKPAEVSPSPSAALDRIQIGDDVRQRVSELLSPGSSLIVSDEGPSSETGKGTDIIVLTR